MFILNLKSKFSSSIFLKHLVCIVVIYHYWLLVWGKSKLKCTKKAFCYTCVFYWDVSAKIKMNLCLKETFKRNVQLANTGCEWLRIIEVYKFLLLYRSIKVLSLFTNAY